LRSVALWPREYDNVGAFTLQVGLLGVAGALGIHCGDLDIVVDRFLRFVSQVEQ